MIPWAVSAFFILAGGFLSDFLFKKTHSLRKARSHLIFIGLLLSGTCFSLIAYVSTLPSILTFLSLGLGFGFLTNAPIYAFNSDLFPNRPSTAQGIISAVFASAGVIAPIITGFIVDWSKSFDAAFLLIAIICAIGALGVFLLHPRK